MAEYLRVTRVELEDLFSTFSGQEWTSKDLFDTAKEWGLTEEGHQDVYMEFSKLYLAYRRSMKHRGITLIKPSSNQWKNLIDVTDEALAFAQENGMDRRSGFRVFLEVAGQVTNSMKLHEIRAKADRIHEHFVALAICEGDRNTKITEQIWERWNIKYMASTGENPQFVEPLQYQYFVEAAELCRQFKHKPVDFVNMIFNEFAWIGTPKPYHMVGPKAKELLQFGHDQKFGKTRVKRISLKHITQKKDDNDRD